MATKTETAAKASRSAASEKAKIMRRVKGLLAQAEHPNTDEKEAQQFAAKAAELLARHGLDAATVRADKGQKPEGITRYDVKVSGQGWHGKARAELVYSVVEAYGTEACTINNRMNGQDRLVAVIGTASMIEALKVLIPSIMIQAETTGTRARKAHMAEAGPKIGTAANRNIASRTFYRSYLRGYGQGVAEKIAASRTELAEEVKGKPGELVLVTDAERIKADFAKRFPELSTTAADKVSRAGLAAGQRDGRTADTGQTKVRTGRKAVNR